MKTTLIIATLIALASCSKKYTCQTTNNGEVIKTTTFEGDKEEVAQYEKNGTMTIGGNEFKTTCK